MRFLHVSDLHIGKQVNGFPMLDDISHILQQVLDLADERKVDAVLIAGDIYDRSQPQAEAVKIFDWFLTELVKRDIACICIAGNHDSPERIAYGRDIMAARGVHLSPVFNGKLDSCQLQDEYGTVTFWLMPFLHPVNARKYLPDQAQEIHDYTDALRAVIEACDVDFAERNVILAHQYVTAEGHDTFLSDSELAVGGLDAADASVFDGFDYVALGHIHRPQAVGRDTVRYAGSPLKYSASEIKYPKSVPVVDLGEKGQVAIDLVPLKPLHDMRHIKGPIDELMAADVVAGQNADDYLYVTLTDQISPTNPISRLRQVYHNVMAVDYENAGSEAPGVGEAAQGDVDHIDPLKFFDDLFKKQNGAEMTDEQREVVQAALHAAIVKGGDAR